MGRLQPRKAASTETAPPTLRVRAACYAALVLVMLSWSMCYPLITLGVAEAPPFFFATMRAVLAGFTLLIVALMLGRPLPRTRVHWAWIGLAGLGATTIAFSGMFSAGGIVAPGIATVLENTQPLIAAALAAVVLGEVLAWSQWLGLGIGLAGIVITAVAAPGFTAGESSVWGYAFVIAGATGVAVGNLALKRLAGKTDPLMTMGLMFALGSIPLAAVTLTTETLPALSGRFLIVLLTLAIAGTAVPFTIWIVVLKHLKLGVANAFAFLAPIFGVTISIIWFGERFTLAYAIGGGLILLGLLVVTRPRDDRQDLRPPAISSIDSRSLSRR